MTGRSADGPTDEVLVARALADPRGRTAERALAELFGRYQGRVYLWCHRYVRDHERALDLAQDALLRAYRALGTYDRRAPFACWLYAIARNRCYSAMRPVSLTRDENAELDDVRDPEPGVEERMEAVEDEALVLRLMRSELEPREQDALWLRCQERLPVPEVTRRLGLTGASGARAVLQSARRKLRAALARVRAADERRSS